ncbi:metallophosphoesterase [Halobacillus litoralis]|uniref:metallophosphoesterase n=1 Tax=Halobacillus litoralis TaxID=45668 RepID=UPI001CD264F2|nr:metallophosphoesterase [Halobacillus litoralis]MCA0970318.1 metallophosphoesterase [Halobacillus litoralis]
MLTSFIILFLLLICMSGYMLFRAQYDHVRFHQITDHQYPSSTPLNILFISDIHNRVIKQETLRSLTDVDLVIIGGDLVDRRTPLKKLKENLSTLQSFGAPIFFVPGNNDHELEGGDLISLLEKEEVKVLANEDQKISLHGSDFLLSGLDPYFLKPRRRMKSAIHDTRSYQILCVHDPFVFERMNREDRQKFRLILTGHTHGGQIRFLGIGPYKRGGMKLEGSQHFLISEGYGTSLVPLRLGTAAECHMIEISGIDAL